ncbi:MAG: hypothetical protein ACOX3A_10130 [bacterium]
MFELLEDLKPEFSRMQRRVVDLAEITLLSVQLSVGQGVVVTNRNIYFLHKKLFGVRVNCVALEQVHLIQVAGKTLVLEGETGKLGKLDFSQRKELLVPVYKKLKQVLPSLSK